MQAYAIIVSDPAKTRDRIVARRVNKESAVRLAERLNAGKTTLREPIYFVVREPVGGRGKI
jgi:hypothetical protein